MRTVGLERKPAFANQWGDLEFRRLLETLPAAA
jgi:hypothetical protein